MVAGQNGEQLQGHVGDPVGHHGGGGQGQLAEVVWQGAGGQSLTYRMAPGTEDVSGDFTAYGWEDTLTAGAYTVTCKGEDALVFLAVWSDGTYSFSLHTSAGLTTGQTAELIESLSPLDA